MRKTAMVGEAVNRAFKSPEDIEVRSFGRKRHGRGRERGLAIESGAGEHGPGKKMSDGLQTDFVTQGAIGRCGRAALMKIGSDVEERRFSAV